MVFVLLPKKREWNSLDRKMRPVSSWQVPFFANGFELELFLFQVDVGGWKRYIVNFRYEFHHRKKT